MNYILKHFDTDLLKFSADENSSNPNYEIIWINKEKEYLLPLDFQATSDGLGSWIKHRTIPKNRAFVNNFLAKCGLNINRPMNVISVSKGLSLNDCYWVVEEGFEGSFEKSNLYDNNFSNILAYIAFTGYGSSIRTSLMSSPEFTTNGMLPKCWRRRNGKVMLYKGATSGFSNTGNEPYSEFLAYQIAEAMGLNAIAYNLSKWKGNLCSTCELFTSKELSYMPVGRIVTKGGMDAVREYMQKQGDEFVKALNDMIVFDAIICNVDRHFGNFGFLVDTKNNKIKAPAPLFDHGNSLFNFAGKDDMENSSTLQSYVDTLMPCVYDDFIDEAKKVLTHERRVALHSLLDFRFKKHSRYNLPAKRLKLIEEQVRIRAKLLLD
jgi:hypothetical protein